MIAPVRHHCRYSLSYTAFGLVLILLGVLSGTAVSAALTTSTSTTTTANEFNGLTPEQIDSYHDEGYIYVKGLLPSDLIEELANSVQDAALAAVAKRNGHSPPGGYFSLLQSNNIFASPTTTTTTTATSSVYNPNDDNHNTTTTATNNHIYRKVAIDSILPKVVAQLMRLNNHTNNNGENVRCLRDIILVKDVNEMTTCGWHVDDIGFWPISYSHNRGINVWIALDDMKHSGNMALAPKSHVASWRYDAYATIGQNRTQDHGPTQQQMRESQQQQNKATTTRTNYLTCDMHLVNETLSNHIESTAVYMDNIERGDIIFSSRLLFHRTMPVTPEGLQEYSANQKAAMTNEPPQWLKRYSIRYEPGTAQINSGWNVEWSVLHDIENAGRTLNDIAALYPQYAFHPQVWPTTEGIEAMDRVTQQAEEWTKQAKQIVYETLFSSSSSSSSSAVTTNATMTTTTTVQNDNEKIIEID